MKSMVHGPAGRKTWNVRADDRLEPETARSGESTREGQLSTPAGGFDGVASGAVRSTLSSRAGVAPKLSPGSQHEVKAVIDSRPYQWL